MKISKGFCILSLFLLFSCTPKQQKIPAFNTSYSAYISSFTSGVISKKSTIKVSFTSAVFDSSSVSGEQLKDLLRFKPGIEGKLVARNNLLEFIPAHDLRPGQVYTAKLELDRLMEVPDSLSRFEFGFQVLRPAFDWGPTQLLAQPGNQMTWYTLKGTLLSADEENVEDIGKLLSARIAGEKLDIRWAPGDYPRQYVFEIDSIERREQKREIYFEVNKASDGTEKLDNREVALPALGDFQYLSHDIFRQPGNHIRLNFSDPIKTDQDLSGLITMAGENNLRFEVENTSILIYPEKELYGTKSLTIFPGIRNILGYKFKDQKDISLHFVNEKPQVKILGSGNIIPVNEKLLLPFQAISLTAVDVKVVRIAEHNILQFLQNNDYDGDYELYRVGEVVATQKIELTPKGSLRDWNTYSIDISKLIEPEAGALYRLYLSFNKDYSIYECPEASTEKEEDDDDEYWYYDDYEYYHHNDAAAYDRYDYYFRYPPGYRWKQRDNPCHVSYYIQERFATRNLLATNIGLIAKRTEGGFLDFTVNDLLDNLPVNGAEVKICNYQGRELTKVRTDNEGFARVKIAGRPYFAVASKGSQKVYLKLQDGESLSLSAFQVEGNNVKEGLKGFIYGERGVWRPGDTLFLNFILEDEMNKLPAGHPVHFQLTDPRGLVADRQVTPKGDQRIYNFTTHTPGTAVTGTYTATVKVGDVIFQKRLPVETVKPNRLNIDLQFASEILKAGKEGEKAGLSVDWLTGIPAANARVSITADFSQLTRAFEQFPAYTFHDPARNFYNFEKEIFDGTVDANGKTSVALDLSGVNNAPGMLKARFVVKAFEGGGDFSTEYFDRKIAPYDRWIGLKMPEATQGHFLETDKDYSLQVKTVDKEGQPVSMKDLEVKIYKTDWHWWYNSESENLARFVNNEVTHLVSSGKVSTVNGDGTYTLKVPYPNWGRFLVRICDPQSGHCSGQVTYFDWPAGKKGDRPELAGATLLSFKAEKEQYQVGEEVVADIPVSKGSRVLITVENGSGILKKEWLRPGENSETVKYRLKTTAAMAPNIYISAMLLQPHAQTANDRPMRLYGVLPVKVYDPATQVFPEISCPDVWRPETRVKVQVHEKQGRPMTYTLAVVDDGLLNLTRFQTPDPWNHFYAKEALGVKTWDMYNDVLGAFGGRLEQVFAIGGDMEIAKMENSNLNRFRPMVQHLGPFRLAAGKKATHHIDIPNYVGSVRVMVVAADDKNAYGNASKDVKVRKPLMVLTSLPRLLSPGDEIVLPVTVFAMEDQVRDVKLKLSVGGEVEIAGERSKRISFSKNGEKVVDFKLKVPENRGNAKVRIDASSGNEKAYDQTELKVRLPNPPQRRSESFVLKPGRDTTLRYAPVGVEGTNSFAVEGSTIPAINLQDRLKYLMGYPHGCTEQTVSSVFPLLYLEELMPLSTEMKNTRNQNIAIAIQTIYERQEGSGGILYWPGGSSANGYITSYAGHFLTEAERKGYQLPSGVLARWKKYQQEAARSWRPEYGYQNRLYNGLEQSYRLYTLALAGSAEIGAMNRLREVPDLPEAALWQLAASYLMAGQKDVAARLAERANLLEGTRSWGYWYYGDKLRNRAIKLMVVKKLGKENESFSLARDLAKDLNSNTWYTTHSLAFALNSLIETYSGYAKGGTMQWSFRSSAENKEVTEKGSFYTYHVSRNLDGSFEYTVRNSSSVPVNFVVSRVGIPIDFDIPALANNLSVKVHYQYPDGKAIDVASIRQGQDFVALVTISKSGTMEGYDNMALSQLFPTGWEIINTRLLEVEESGESTYDYKDIRDDRVYTYFDLSHRSSASFKVRLNATYAGRYWLPPVEAEDMYNNEIRAREPGKWVEVVR